MFAVMYLGGCALSVNQPINDHLTQHVVFCIRSPFVCLQTLLAADKGQRDEWWPIFLAGLTNDNTQSISYFIWMS
jgi:hypothetical protein